jgi:hypothetical protein
VLGRKWRSNEQVGNYLGRKIALVKEFRSESKKKLREMIVDVRSGFTAPRCKKENISDKKPSFLYSYTL